jgi:hypothetical protein
MKHQPTNYKLIQAIRRLLKPEGNSAPNIADAVIDVCYPQTVKVAKGEGAYGVLRTGVVVFVRAYLKGEGERVTAADDATAGMWEIAPGFQEVAAQLTHGEYYVPSVADFVPKGKLIALPALFDEARKFIRSKGDECIAEADRMDIAYAALMRLKGKDPPPEP